MYGHLGASWAAPKRDAARRTAIADAAGVRADLLASVVRITVSGAARTAKRETVAAVLASVYAQTPPDRDWEVDIGECRAMSVALCGLLDRYRRRLEGAGRQLHLTGADYDLLPPDTFIG